MIEILELILPITIYVLLLSLLVIGIVLGIKAIISVNKINKILTDIEYKINLVNKAIDYINYISEFFGDIINKFIGK